MRKRENIQSRKHNGNVSVKNFYFEPFMLLTTLHSLEGTLHVLQAESIFGGHAEIV